MQLNLTLALAAGTRWAWAPGLKTRGPGLGILAGEGLWDRIVPGEGIGDSSWETFGGGQFIFSNILIL